MSLLDIFTFDFQANTSGAIAQINALAQANEAAGDATDDAKKSLEEKIKALEREAETAGMSKKEAILYRLAQEGATTADIDRARAALDAADAIEEEGTAVNKLGGIIAGAAAGALSFGAILAGVFERADSIRAIEQTSNALGVAIEDVDAFGKAAQAMGGDAEGARDSLTDMAEKMGEAMSDAESGAAKAFKALGIGLKNADGSAKNSINGILDLAGAVEGLSKSEAIFKIKELGITDNRTVEMVLKGRKELERMLKTQKEQGTITKESAENARKLTEAMGYLKLSVSNAGASFLDSIIPALTKVLEWLGKGVDWMKENKNFVLGFFGAVAAIVAAVYLPAMISAAAATIAATWPFIAIGLAITAAAAAFALIYDDVMNFIEGNDSFIGQVVEKYPLVGKVVTWLIEAFKALWDTLITGAKQIGGFVSAAFMQIVGGVSFAIDYLVNTIGPIETYVADAINVFEAMKEGIAVAFQFIVDIVATSIAAIASGIESVRAFTTSTVAAFQSMADGIASIFAFVVDLVKGSLSFVTGAMDKIKTGIGGVASFLGIGGEDGDDGAAAAAGVDGAMGAAGAYIAGASAAPTNSISSNAITNSTRNSETNVQTGDIIVQTQATDAQGISKDVGSELKGQLKDLEHNSATGVAR